MSGNLKDLATWLVAACWAVPAQADDGALDPHGCHYETSGNHYHCHEGVNAGKSYQTQWRMLMEMRRERDKKPAAEEASHPKQSRRIASKPEPPSGS